VGHQVALGPAKRGGHLEGVERQLGAHVGGDLPADDHAGEDVEDEGQVQEAREGAQVGDVGHLVRPGGREVAVDEVARAIDGALGRGGGAVSPSAAHARKALLAHQPGDPVAAHQGPSPL
jgi:hypothetical protein